MVKNPRATEQMNSSIHFNEETFMQIEIVDCHRSTGVRWSLTLINTDEDNNNITHNYTIQMNQYSGEVTSCWLLSFRLLLFSGAKFLNLIYSFVLCRSIEIIFNLWLSSALGVWYVIANERGEEAQARAHTFGQAHESHCQLYIVTTFELFLSLFDHCHHHFAYKTLSLDP